MGDLGVFEGTVAEYDDAFYGVVIHGNGIKISIPGVLAGEKIAFHIEHTSMHTNRAWGRCDRLISPSPQRVRPVCAYAWPTRGMCPGCPLMHMDPGLQSQLKKQHVMRCFHDTGIRYVGNIPFHTATQNLHYRNRTDLVAGMQHRQFVLGCYKPRTHQILEIRNCPILRAPQNQVLAFIVSQARKMRIPYATQEDAAFGALRYVSTFANANGRVLVDLVCKSASSKIPFWLEGFSNALHDFCAISGVSFSINDSPNNALRVAPSKILWGESRLPEKHGQIASLFNASGFTQLNTDVAAQIYASAREWYGKQPDIVWDLYCGCGAFGRAMRPKKALYGAEFNAAAIDAANRAGAADPWKNRFEVVDLENHWPVLWQTPEVILLDPPRKGLSKTVISEIRRSKCRTLFYMSCNPSTMAQNIAQLSDCYTIERIEAFDMMPQTAHMEVLAMLRYTKNS